MNKSTSGFTIVELLIVIIVIAILSAISIVAFNGVRARAIASQRASATVSVQKALENFFTINGRFPGATEMQGASGATLIGLTLRDVTLSGANDSNSGIRCVNPYTVEVGLCYASHPNTDGTGFTCEAPTVCLNYTLKYMNTDGSTQTVQRGRS